MKRWNALLNAVMGCVAGVFTGYGVYLVCDYNARPGWYAMQSAPWYTGLLPYGVLVLATLAVCLVIKALLRHRGKKGGNAE